MIYLFTSFFILINIIIIINIQLCKYHSDCLVQHTARIATTLHSIISNNDTNIRVCHQLILIIIYYYLSIIIIIYCLFIKQLLITHQH